MEFPKIHQSHFFAYKYGFPLLNWYSVKTLLKYIAFYACTEWAGVSSYNALWCVWFAFKRLQSANCWFQTDCRESVQSYWFKIMFSRKSGLLEEIVFGLTRPPQNPIRCEGNLGGLSGVGEITANRRFFTYPFQGYSQLIKQIFWKICIVLKKHSDLTISHNVIEFTNWGDTRISNTDWVHVIFSGTQNKSTHNPHQSKSFASPKWAALSSCAGFFCQWFA